MPIHVNNPAYPHPNTTCQRNNTREVWEREGCLIWSDLQVAENRFCLGIVGSGGSPEWMSVAGIGNSHVKDPIGSDLWWSGKTSPILAQKKGKPFSSPCVDVDSVCRKCPPLIPTPKTYHLKTSPLQKLPPRSSCLLVYLCVMVWHLIQLYTPLCSTDRINMLSFFHQRTQRARCQISWVFICLFLIPSLTWSHTWLRDICLTVRGSCLTCWHSVLVDNIWSKGEVN